MFAQLLLGGLFFAAGIFTLLLQLITDPARELGLALLTTIAVIGAIAYQARLALDQPATDPTIRQETKP